MMMIISGNDLQKTRIQTERNKQWMKEIIFDDQLRLKRNETNYNLYLYDNTIWFSNKEWL
jgi:hypothetical protein